MAGRVWPVPTGRASWASINKDSAVVMVRCLDLASLMTGRDWGLVGYMHTHT